MSYDRQKKYHDIISSNPQDRGYLDMSRFNRENDEDDQGRLNDENGQDKLNDKEYQYSAFSAHEETYVGHHEISHEQDSLKNKIQNLKEWFKGLSNKQRIMLVTGIIVAIGMLAFATWWFVLRVQPITPTPAVIEVPEEEEEEREPAIVPSKLTGLPVKPEVNKRQVTSVIVENSPDARPQSGISEAGIVFEAIAESGITRFMAMFQDTSTDNIGPIRSVRPYFLDWLLPFDSTIAHVGGSPHALQEIPSLGVKTIGQNRNPDVYRRDSGRFAPHNMYSSISGLRDAQNQHGYTESDFEGFPRKPKEEPLDEPKATTVNLNFSSSQYNIRYDYDPEDNSYQRFMGGRPHVDAGNNQQIAPKVVIALAMNRSVMSNGIHTVYDTVGSGAMYVFQDGDVIEGRWEKPSRQAQFTFTDTEGEEIELTPGKTWVGVLDSANAVNYEP